MRLSAMVIKRNQTRTCGSGRLDIDECDDGGGLTWIMMGSLEIKLKWRLEVCFSFY